MRRLTTAVAVLVAALAVGCSGAGEPAAGAGEPDAAAATSRPVDPSPTPTWAPTEADIAAVCAGRPQPAAPARAATGPRPVRVVVARTDRTWGLSDYYTSYGDLAAIQVVACLTDRPTAKRVGWCDYFPGYDYYGMHQRRFEFVVRELRTARVLGRRAVLGADAACPKNLFREPPGGKLYTQLTFEQVTAVVSPYERG